MPKNISAAKLPQKSPPSNNEHPPIMREYQIGGTRYIVSATFKAGANEDAAAKLRRLIQNELARQSAALHTDACDAHTQNDDTHEQNMKT